MEKPQLFIKLPKDECDCHSDCICKSYIKCSNSCFCGNQKFLSQPRTIYSASTPDYRNSTKKNLKKSNSFVNFEEKNQIFPIDKDWYHSPRYFLNIEINRQIRNRVMSPQPLKLRSFKRKMIGTPHSV